MSKQDQIIDIPDDKIADWIISSGADPNSNATAQKPPAAKIPRVPFSEKHAKYYVPKAVSIGPYHFKQPKLQVVQELKAGFTLKLLSNNKVTITSLYKKLGEPEMVKELRSFYEQNSTDMFSDTEFTKMMLLDSCFILHFINSFSKDAGLEALYETPNLLWRVHQDLLLLGNQIPFKVLWEVMNLGNVCDLHKICLFIVSIEELYFDDQDPEVLRAVKSLKSGITDKRLPHHLLDLLHRTRAPQTSDGRTTDYDSKSSTFPDVDELLDVGVRFKPSDSLSLNEVDFRKGWFKFSATLELPPITLQDDSTVLFWLNLIAYEKYSVENDAWVISYVCLLQSMISKHEDVKVLINAGVLENCFGNDRDVVDFFNEISTDLVPRNQTYINVKNKIQKHSDDWSDTPISEFSQQYRKSPWKFLSLIGAFILFFLTAVQTYFTVWSIE